MAKQFSEYVLNTGHDPYCERIEAWRKFLYYSMLDPECMSKCIGRYMGNKYMNTIIVKHVTDTLSVYVALNISHEPNIMEVGAQFTMPVDGLATPELMAEFDKKIDLFVKIKALVAKKE